MNIKILEKFKWLNYLDQNILKDLKDINQNLGLCG